MYELVIMICFYVLSLLLIFYLNVKITDLSETVEDIQNKLQSLPNEDETDSGISESVEHICKNISSNPEKSTETVEESVENLVEESAEESAEESVEESVENLVEESVENLVEESLE